MYRARTRRTVRHDRILHIALQSSLQYSLHRLHTDSHPQSITPCTTCTTCTPHALNEFTAQFTPPRVRMSHCSFHLRVQISETAAEATPQYSFHHSEVHCRLLAFRPTGRERGLGNPRHSDFYHLLSYLGSGRICSSI